MIMGVRMGLAFVAFVLSAYQFVLFASLPPHRHDPTAHTLQQQAQTAPRNSRRKSEPSSETPKNKNAIASSRKRKRQKRQTRKRMAEKVVAKASTKTGETTPHSKPFVEEVSHGVLARAWEPWPKDRPRPCYAPTKTTTSKKQRQIIQQQRPLSPPDTHDGFLFMKLMKVGGSSAAGVHIRILREVAQQLHSKNNKKKTPTTIERGEEDEPFKYCRGRFEHAWGYEMLADRPRNKSFTWTVVRDPTTRATSQFFHFQVSRQGVADSDYQFRQYLKSEERILLNYYLQVLSTKQINHHVPASKAPSLINAIFDEYDFIGVTERLDESVVCLMMLLGTSMRSILYFSAKSNGGYDDGAFNRTCTYIKPSFVSPGMREYFDSRRWKKLVEWDEVFLQAANRSLDLTIDRLGRTEFEANLEKFQRSQQLARERCLPLEVFPCTSTGEHNKKKACLWKDSACGHKCLDLVADELGI